MPQHVAELLELVVEGFVQLAAIQDDIVEGDESVRVDISSVTNGDETGFQRVTATLVDDEPTNAAPTDVNLTATAIAENQPVGIPVGALSTVDPDIGDTHGYTLVSGIGSEDNAFFSINGTTLQTARSFNYEAGDSHSIRIRTTDLEGLWFERVFAIQVSDVEEPALELIEASGDPASGVTLRWTSEAGYSYQVKYSQTLASLDWHNVGPIFVANDGESTLSFTDHPTAAIPRRFYIVERTPLE